MCRSDQCVTGRCASTGFGGGASSFGGRFSCCSRQLADELRRRVQVGALATGERLPTVRTLASTLGVTPETVAAAYKQLTQQGYLRGEVGRGTFVAAPPLAASIARLILSVGSEKSGLRVKSPG